MSLCRLVLFAEQIDSRWHRCEDVNLETGNRIVGAATVPLDVELLTTGLSRRRRSQQFSPGA